MGYVKGDCSIKANAPFFDALVSKDLDKRILLGSTLDHYYHCLFEGQFYA